MQLGAKITMVVNDLVQFNGFVDQISTSLSNGSIEQSYRCRDFLGRLADSYLDPTFKVSEKLTLLEAMKATVKKAGYDYDIVGDSDAESGLITGRKVAYINKSKTARGQKKTLDRLISKDTKAQKGEGVYQYLDRIAKAHGLCLWAGTDGRTIYVSTPTFDQSAHYKLVHRLDGRGNNIKGLSVELNCDSQPSFIYGEAKPASKAGNATTLRRIAVNEFVGYDRAGGSKRGFTPYVKSVLDEKKKIGAVLMSANADLEAIMSAGLVKNLPLDCRGVFLEDTISHNEQELDFAIRRKLAEAQRNFLKYTITMPFHSLNDVVFGINTVASLVDESNRFDGELWIVSRTLSGGTGSGQETALELIPKYAYAI